MKKARLSIFAGLLALFALAQAPCPGSDVDEDGWTTGDGDCDDENSSIYPGAAEACDGIDNDCDGRIDDPAECYEGDAPSVALQSGPIQGLAGDESTFAYLGIPFAAPPVGEKRWLRPTDPEPWTTPLPATTFGPACPQYVSQDTDGDGVNDMVYLGDEDCLFLNVWQPREVSPQPRPIMVWIHGGGNAIGTADTALYYGPTLAAEADAIVITIQYRLSFLGWLYHEAIQSGDPAGDSGNLGLLDILQALRWVQQNGAAFGGDTSRVTLFGESAGGFDTWAAILARPSKGLFHRAIIESGSPLYSTVAQARDLAQRLIEWLVVADGLTTPEDAADFLTAQGTAWTHDYLYSKTAEEIMQVAFDNGGIGLAEYGPIQDGTVLPRDVLDALFRGDYNRVPILLGANRDEMKIFYFPYADMTEEEYQTMMTELYGDYKDDLEALYPRDAYDPATPYNQFCDISDGYLELISTEYIAYHVADYQDTFLYHFTYDDLAPPLDYKLGAAHSLEIPFVFGNFTEEMYARDTEVDRKLLSENMMAWWACFAATGNPSNCRSIDYWPKFSLEGDEPLSRMVLDTPNDLETIPDINFARWNIWAEMLELDVAPVPVPE